MFFRNLNVSRFDEPFTVTAEELEAKLSAMPFRHCGQLEQVTVGFTPPLGRNSDQLVHVSDGRLMICLTSETKVVPASVVNEEANQIICQIQEAQGRKVGRKEKKEIQEKALLELLPRAFAKSSSTYAYVDVRKGWLIVDASSSTKAEEVVSLIRKALGTLPVSRLTTEGSPSLSMTQWLANQEVPENFMIGAECDLVESEQGATINCRKKDLDSEEIRNHLEKGMQVSRLAMTWKDRISFTVDDSLIIRKIKFLDGVMEEAAEVEADNEAQQFDADFHIMAAEIAGLLEDLLKAFGGCKKAEGLMKEAA